MLHFFIFIGQIVLCGLGIIGVIKYSIAVLGRKSDKWKE